jgi:hypothetical protein
MGGNARGRHGLFRCGAFAAARVRRPSILKIRELPPADCPSDNFQAFDWFLAMRARRSPVSAQIKMQFSAVLWPREKKCRALQ